MCIVLKFKYRDIWAIHWWEPLQPYIPPLPTPYDEMLREYDHQQNLAAAENRDIVAENWDIEEVELQEEWPAFPEQKDRYCG